MPTDRRNPTGSNQAKQDEIDVEALEWLHGQIGRILTRLRERQGDERGAVPERTMPMVRK